MMMCRKRGSGEYGSRTVSRRNHAVCFTLIELLIVIAIIAILAAMMLPALGKARDKGYAIFCLNNQRETGKLFMFYAQDYTDYMPIAYGQMKDGEILVRSWLQAINPMLGRTSWQKISKASKSLICPVLESKVPPDENGERNTTYTYNRRLGDLDYVKKGYAGYHPRKLANAKYPSVFVTLMEGIKEGERITLVTASSDIDNLSHPHNRRNQHLYADGHAAAVNMYSVYGDWRAWCQPYSYFPYRKWDETTVQW